MVSLKEVVASNAQIPSALPKRLVAVFAGATSGIGEVTLKTLVKYSTEPRIYLFARNPALAARAIAECRQINPSGDYIFVKVDLSLVRETDIACEYVKSREKLVNLLFLSAGEIKFDRARKLPYHHRIMAVPSAWPRR
jgi:NADP-dependent 3-hydroxy acid dehydrogenase YdfG